MIAELFEEKTEPNKGIYLKVDNRIPREIQFELVANKLQAGYINSNDVDFYRKHGACNDQTLQSLNTFDQIATIWRLNSYGIGNQQTLEFKIDKINEVIKKFNSTYIQNLFSTVIA